MRQAMLVLQPHGQFNRSATRFTAALSSSSADWARHPPANKPSTSRLRTGRLILNRRMFLGNSYYLRSGVRQTHFVGNQADDGAEREHPKSDPDPGHQGKNISLDHSALIVGREPGEVDIEIFVQSAADGYFRRWLLTGLIKAPFRIARSQRFSIARYVHSQPLPGISVVLTRLDVRDPQMVVAHVGAGAGRHFLGDVLIERRPGIADEHEHDAHVNQISAVAPRVAMCQLNSRRDEPDTVLGANGRRAFPELGYDGGSHERTQAERHQRVGV